MRAPLATYRLQFHPGFGFEEARQVVPYLDALGITDLYASPLLVARSGSAHGYDATDAYHLNPDLGTEQEFREMVAALHEHGMGLLLDVVPNHMAASAENPWWMDVLENGPASPYADFFDIDWKSEGVAGLQGKVLLPVLGAPFGEVLERGELAVEFGGEGFSVRYYDHRFPIALSSYGSILTVRRPGPARARRERTLLELRRLVSAFQGFDRAQRAMSEGARLRRRKTLKRALSRLYRGQAEVRRFVDEKLALLNGQPDHPKSFDRLERLLSAQHYRLAFWRSGIDEVNYRRFFDINDLVAVRVEDPRVFERRHARLVELARKGAVTGFRIDHVDGLLDPLQYLQRLQDRLAAGRSHAPAGETDRFYVVVEKILAGPEALPPAWAAAGTTGYEFIHALSGLFLDVEGWARLREGYALLTGRREEFAEVRRKCKLHVLHALLEADFRRLSRELARLASADRHARNLGLADLQRALAEVSAALPVYRTYLRETSLSPADRQHLEQALAGARPHLPDRAASAALAFLRRVLLLFPRPGFEVPQDWIRFVQRWQQFTGPLMAKGLEDTAFYRHHPLLSLNEVGASPEDAARFAEAKVFHDWNRARGRAFSHTLNATSTHDTKRSEDARARIHLLAEIPEEWQGRLQRWRKWNEPRRTVRDGRPIPDANEEILLYQSLLGVWPLDRQEEAGLLARMKEYTVKAAREAKLHTSWIDPDEEHEKALLAFLEATLEDGPKNRFLGDLRRFLGRLAWAAAVHSLGQVLLKIVSPGVPDFYQGTELWTLTLVDPDNRRPVDFEQRARWLEELLAAGRTTRRRQALVEELRTDWRDGRLKLFVTAQALRFRRDHPELFQAGEYVPLLATGQRASHVCGLARRARGRWVAAVVPRGLLRLGQGEEPGGAEGWRGTSLRLPSVAPAVFRDVLTGERVPARPRRGAGRELALSGVWNRLPVALLSGLEETPARRPHRR